MNPIDSQPSWIFVIEENELQENSVNLVFPRGLPVLLIKKTGQIYAISNKCAHMACGLGGGTLKDYTIQCPCHDWRYDIRTGEFLDASVERQSNSSSSTTFLLIMLIMTCSRRISRRRSWKRCWQSAARHLFRWPRLESGSLSDMIRKSIQRHWD